MVATGSGTVDLTDLSPFGISCRSSSIDPSRAILLLGEGSGPNYTGISGPTEFGTGGFTLASISTGSRLDLNPPVARSASTVIGVPQGYVSGTPLSGTTATWDNTTLADLGVTPGVYTWTWGTGANADSLTLFAGVPVPEPGTLGLLGTGVIGLAGMARRKFKLP